MTQKRKMIAVFMLFVMLLTAIGSPYGSFTEVRAAKRKTPTLKLSTSSVTLQQGEKTTVKIKKKNVAVKKSKWAVKNKKIARVTKRGIVSGIKEGKTVLTCKVKYKATGTKKYKNRTLKCNITVRNASDSTSAAPLQSPDASTSQVPSATQPPSASQVPSATQPPSTSQDPSATQPPSMSQDPDATQPPSTSQDPDATQPPSTSQDPDATQPPSTSQGPDATQPPSTSQGPDATQPPTPTGTPEAVPGPQGSYDFSASALGFASQLGAGINIGNTLESNNTVEYLEENGYQPSPLQDLYLSGSKGLDVETSWGCPKITKTLIDQIKAAGFTTVRIPVSYINHVKIESGSDGKKVYTIDEQWLNRVKEVVDWAIEDELYVIINIHHDGADNCTGDVLNLYGGEQATWLSPLNNSGDAYAQMENRFVSLWTQIATKFKDYPNQLIFEDMNEFHHGYNDPDESWYTVQNKLHQAFVDAVRGTGGYNEGRYLLVPGYNTNIGYTIKGLDVPTDIAANQTVYQGNTVGHIMVAVHYYDPYTYAADNPSDTVWGSGSGSSTTWANESYLDDQMGQMETNFVNKGIPVIIGEYGAPTHNITASEDEIYRAYYYSCVVQAAAKHRLVPVAWDNGTTYQLISREGGGVTQQKIVQGIIKYVAMPSETIAKPWE